MMDTKVKVTMVSDNKRYEKEVEGRVVRFNDFRRHTFLLHRNPEASRNNWRVSESTTGMYVSEGRTQKEALTNAKTTLTIKGANSINKAIIAGLEKLSHYN